MVVEIGLSMALLVTAGLVINSFNRLVRVDSGIESNQLLFLSLDLPEHSYGEQAVLDGFFARMVPRLGAIPTIQGVALAERLPPHDVESFAVSGLVLEGGADPACMRILRHEAGHAIDTAYRLHFKRSWREVFGPYSQPYPQYYRPRPNSRSFVLHLDAWYAQQLASGSLDERR